MRSGKRPAVDPSGDRGHVDYTATAHRPGWGSLPPAVRDTLRGWAGGHVDAVHPAGGGFTHGFAALLEGPRPVFAKAIPLADAHIHPAYAREVEVLRIMPPGLPVPRLLEHAVVSSRGGPSAAWLALATEPVAGRMPGQPWTMADARAVHTSCGRANDVLAGTLGAAGSGALGGLGTLAAEWTTFLETVGGGLGLLGREGRPSFLPSWFRGLSGDPLAARIVAHAARATDALGGGTPLNNDLRADNIIISASAMGSFPAGSAWICDWNYLALGPAWADWVALWPSMHADGLALGQLGAWGLTSAADPADLDAWLAVLFLYYADAGVRPEVPGSPRLRDHARLCSRQLLDLLAARWAG